MGLQSMEKPRHVPKIITATSTEHSTPNSYAFLNSPFLRYLFDLIYWGLFDFFFRAHGIMTFCAMNLRIDSAGLLIDQKKPPSFSHQKFVSLRSQPPQNRFFIFFFCNKTFWGGGGGRMSVDIQNSTSKKSFEHLPPSPSNESCFFGLNPLKVNFPLSWGKSKVPLLYSLHPSP